MTALMGAINASMTSSNKPNLFNNNPIPTTIAVMAATIKKIGFIRMVAPNLIKAPPKVVTIPVKSLNDLPISAGLILPKAALNTLAF